MDLVKQLNDIISDPNRKIIPNLTEIEKKYEKYDFNQSEAHFLQTIGELVGEVKRLQEKSDFWERQFKWLEKEHLNTTPKIIQKAVNNPPRLIEWNGHRYKRVNG